MIDRTARLARLAGALALAGAVAVSAVAPVAASTLPSGHAAGAATQVVHHGARKVAFYADANVTYTCATGAQPAAGAKKYGFAVLNATAHGYLEVTVSLKGVTPSTKFDVWVNQDPGACPLTAATKLAAVKTNAKGNGTAHLRVKVVTGATSFWVSVVSGSNVYRTPAAALVVKTSTH